MIDPIEQKAQQAAELLKTIAHPIRLQIILQLSQQASLNVSAFRLLLNTEQSLLSHHLIKMQDRGVLHRSRKGKEIFYSIVDPNFIEAVELLLTTKEQPIISDNLYTRTKK